MLEPSSARLRSSRRSKGSGNLCLRIGKVVVEEDESVVEVGGGMAGAMLVCCWKYVGLLGVVVVMGGERVIGRYELRELICEEGDLVVCKGYLVWLSQG